jgi:hypothetical protein
MDHLVHSGFILQLKELVMVVMGILLVILFLLFLFIYLYIIFRFRFKQTTILPPTPKYLYIIN